MPALVLPRLRYPRSLFHDMPRLCHARCQSQIMHCSVIHAFYLWSCPGSGILAVILRSCMVLSSMLSVVSLIHITAITLYCRLLYRTAMFVNQRWACSSLMTTIQKSWNLSLYSNNNQQWYNNIWTHYTLVIMHFVQLFPFKKGGSVMV